MLIQYTFEKFSGWHLSTYIENIEKVNFGGTPFSVLFTTVVWEWQLINIWEMLIQHNFEQFSGWVEIY